MRKINLAAALASTVLLSGCAKEIPLIEVSTNPETQTMNATVAEQTIESTTQASEAATSEEEKVTETETVFQTIEEATTVEMSSSAIVIGEETTEDDETEAEPEEHEYTSRVVEVTTQAQETAASGDNNYGITGLTLYDYGTIPNAYLDIFQIAYLEPGAYTSGGAIKDLKLYDLKGNQWIASYKLVVNKDGKSMTSGYLTSFHVENGSTGNTVTTYETESKEADSIKYSIEQFGKKLWYILESKDGITATWYDGAAVKHNILELASSIGSFSQKEDCFYYAKDGVIRRVLPGGKETPITLDKSFYVNKISGVFEYPYSEVKAIVRGTNEEGNESSAIVDLESGELIYEGTINYYSACDNSVLILNSFENGTLSEVRVYRNGFPQVSYSIAGSMVLGSMYLTDDTLLIYYKTTDGATDTYHLYRYDDKHTLKASSRIDVAAGSELAGEVLMDTDGKFIVPIRGADGGISFFKWDSVIVSKWEPYITIKELHDTAD